jgi:4'-phosphopantetheinyl transferase EntD
MKQDLWKRLFTDAEISSLKNINHPVEQMRHAAIMFSAKEAYYKYDCPLNERQIDFTDVEVHIDHDSRQFSLNVDGYNENHRLTGYFVSGLTHVMTMLAR